MPGTHLNATEAKMQLVFGGVSKAQATLGGLSEAMTGVVKNTSSKCTMETSPGMGEILRSLEVK